MIRLFSIRCFMVSVLKEAEGTWNRLMKIMLHFWMNEWCCYEVWPSKIYKKIKFLLLIIHSHFKLTEDHLYRDIFSDLSIFNHLSWCFKVYKLCFEHLESNDVLITLIFPHLTEFLISRGSRGMISNLAFWHCAFPKSQVVIRPLAISSWEFWSTLFVPPRMKTFFCYNV